MSINNYHNISANLTLIVFFLNVEIFKKKKTLNENKGSDETFQNMSFVKMESSTLINYSTNKCQSGQGIMVLYIDSSFMVIK
jgi:hypothetical protein